MGRGERQTKRKYINDILQDDHLEGRWNKGQRKSTKAKASQRRVGRSINTQVSCKGEANERGEMTRHSSLTYIVKGEFNQMKKYILMLLLRSSP